MNRFFLFLSLHLINSLAGWLRPLPQHIQLLSCPPLLIPKPFKPHLPSTTAPSSTLATSFFCQPLLQLLQPLQPTFVPTSFLNPCNPLSCPPPPQPLQPTFLHISFLNPCNPLSCPPPLSTLATPFLAHLPPQPFKPGFYPPLLLPQPLQPTFLPTSTLATHLSYSPPFSTH